MVFDFPLLKKWDISAKQYIDGWFPTEDEVTLHIEDLDIDFKGGLRLDENGYLDPVVYGIKINFGKTMITNTNWFLETIFHGIVEFSIVMIENSAWFWGEYVFTNMLGPVMDKFANHYQMPQVIESIADGTDASWVYFVDYRNTRNPYIGENRVVFSLYGEMYALSRDRCDHYDPEQIYLLPEVPDSQLVMSPTFATCLAQQISQTDLGKYILNKRYFNALIHNKDDVTTNTLEKDFPLFKAKLGDNKPLRFNFSYKNMKIDFYKQGSDFYAEYTVGLQVQFDYEEEGYRHMNLDSKELFFDELPWVFAADIQVRGKLMYIDIHEFRLAERDMYGRRDYPHRNTMNLSRQEYH